MTDINVNVNVPPPPQAGVAPDQVQVHVDAATNPAPPGQVRVWVAVFERGFGHEIVRKTAIFINPNDTVDEFLREVFVKLSPLLDYCHHPAALSLAVSGRAMDPAESIRPLLVNPLFVVEAPTPTFTQRGRLTVGSKMDDVAAQIKSMSDRVESIQSIQKETQRKLDTLNELDRKVGVESHHSVRARFSVVGAPSQISAIVGPRDAQGNAVKFPVTWYVVMCSLSASAGGLLFGYDIGITGGVTSMRPFKLLFFPGIAARDDEIKRIKELHEAEGTTPDEEAVANARYCVYDDQILQLFVSSLFITGMFSSLASSFIQARWGRRITMLIAGLWFLFGTILLTTAQVTPLLVIGRICWGVGVGMANSTVPLYLSEMAPAHLRGALNILFQLATTIGILLAQFINLGVQNMESGFRWSLGLSAIPGSILTLGAILLPNTPSSLLELGHLSQAHDVLRKIRGNHPRVDEEYNQLVDECKRSAALSNSRGWQKLFTPAFRCSLLVVVMLPFLQQVVGINSIMFYSNQLFESAGINDPLTQTVIVGLVNVCSTFVSIYAVDKIGRRKLLIEGAVQMCISLVLMSIMWGTGAASSGSGGKWAVFFTSIYIAGFAWSWGPVAWLVPTEIMPLEMRSAGMSIATTVNFLFTSIIGQAFLTMLCNMKYGIFLFFGAFCVIAIIYTMLFVPETQGIQLEQIMDAVHNHWFWGSYTPASHINTEQQSSEKRGDNMRMQLNDAPSSDRLR